MVKNSLINSLNKLTNHIKTKRKFQFLLLLIFTVFVGLLEILSLASVVPFVRLITEENFVQNSFFVSKFFDLKDKQYAIIILGIIFSALFLISSISRIVLIFITARLSKTITAELSINIYKAVLYNSYSEHIKIDSNSIVASISQKVYQIGAVLTGVINLISFIFFFLHHGSFNFY